MGDRSNIEWTDTTWNPIRGCSRVSAGCERCYAERQAARHAGPGGAYEGLVRIVNGGSKWTGKIRPVPEKLEEPLRWRKPRRIFVNSMSDLFHENISNEFIDLVFAVMALATQHRFQVLTKRPQRMREYLSSQGRSMLVRNDMEQDSDHFSRAHQRWLDRPAGEPWWPLPNVLIGVSVEDQESADERIPLLLDTPAAVRFVSYEPALGPVDFTRIEAIKDSRHRCGIRVDALVGRFFESGFPENRIDWLIVGGESGPGARPCDVEWIRSAVQQCKAAGVPVFVKQLGARVYDRNDRGFEEDLETYVDTGEWTNPRGWPHTVEPDPDDTISGYIERYQGASCRVHFADRKGADPAEWPADLRVREAPE